MELQNEIGEDAHAASAAASAVAPGFIVVATVVPLAAATEACVEVVHVENRYFGDTVTIAGLLGGRDIIDALQNAQSEDLIVLPAEALNADDIFIDDVPMDELRKALAPASICTGYEVTEALRSV